MRKAAVEGVEDAGDVASRCRGRDDVTREGSSALLARGGRRGPETCGRKWGSKT